MKNISKENVALSKRDQYFDRLAAVYDVLVKIVFGSKLKEAQCEMLTKLPREGKLLILGGGSGWILEEIAKVRTGLKVDYVEASAKMLNLAQARNVRMEVQYIHGNEQMLEKGKCYDAIFTPFFLDLFGPVRLLASMSILDGHLKKGAPWLFTDFYVPDKGWQKLFAQALIFVMYRFFRLLCRIDARKLPDFDQAFEIANYELQEEKAFYYGMIRSRIYEKKNT